MRPSATAKPRSTTSRQCVPAMVPSTRNVCVCVSNQPLPLQVPPEKNPDWWTVWHANQDAQSDSRFRKLTTSIVQGLEVDGDLLKRMKPLASAYLMWQKLRLENASVQFPRMLAEYDDPDGVRCAVGQHASPALSPRLRLCVCVWRSGHCVGRRDAGAARPV